jgi:hypothetical protein
VPSAVSAGNVFSALKLVLAHFTSRETKGYGTRSVPATLPSAVSCIRYAKLKATAHGVCLLLYAELGLNQTGRDGRLALARDSAAAYRALHALTVRAASP